ncbi:MAG: MotA/TolQ/ExbB proton channel family protein [Bacteroidetes bacterium]|nr:MAG: MotA/TolQ/ExbB proton channel family protein [Bacteroidota bacterium]TNE97542.1 MAG: MotA/TolQ/ExbB proton channel family protein [Bacteroidota bacterium]
MSFSFLLQIEQAAEAAETGVVQVPIWDIIVDSSKGFGLIINVILALMLGYSVFVFVERFFALRKASKEEAGLLTKIREYILDGKIDQAKDYCSRSNSPSARMLEKGISRLGKPLESISASIENTAKLEISRLEQRLSFLATAAGAAPMIGFLGTTVGMVIVFIDLQNATALELGIIAPGIMTAMITTVAGLIVGIISYIGYNYLVAKIGRLVYQMENDALEFMDLLNEPSK